MSPEATPCSPLSFEISPRSGRLQSFTLPPNFKKNETSTSSRRSTCYDEPRQKPPRSFHSESSRSDHSQDRVRFYSLRYLTTKLQNSSLNKTVVLKHYLIARIDQTSRLEWKSFSLSSKKYSLATPMPVHISIYSKL